MQKESRKSLRLEKKILELLAKKYEDETDKGKHRLSSRIGFPQIIEYGIANDYEDYLVMSLHGEKVSSLKEYYTTKEKHNKVCEISKQVVKCLQKVHSVGFVH